MRTSNVVTPACRRGTLTSHLRSVWSLLAIVAFLAACSRTPLGDDDTLVLDVHQVAAQQNGEVEAKALDGTTVSGSITLTVRDNPRLEEVRFFLDDRAMEGIPFLVDREAPFSMALDTATLSNGVHSITVATTVSRGRAPTETTEFVVENVTAAPEGDPEPGSATPESGDGADTNDGATEGEDAEPEIEEPTHEEPTEGDPTEEDEPVRGSDGEPLTWAPPQLVNPTTYHVRQSSSFVVAKLDPSKDYIVEMPDEPLRAGLKILGGRNVVLIGGEIAIPWQGEGASITSRTGLKIQDVTGTVHVEGLLIHGDDITEGIQIDAPDAIVQLQNIGVFGIHARDQVNFSDNHPDIVQSYGNARAIRIDRLTGTTDYQGLFFKADFNGAHGEVTLKRINVIGEPTARYLLWVHPQDGRELVTLEDVWLDVPSTRGGGLGKAVWPDVGASYPYRAAIEEDAAGAYAWWPDGVSTFVDGAAREGRPATGDYVTRDEVGLAYVPADYQDGATLLASR